VRLLAKSALDFAAAPSRRFPSSRSFWRRSVWRRSSCRRSCSRPSSPPFRSDMSIPFISLALYRPKDQFDERRNGRRFPWVQATRRISLGFAASAKNSSASTGLLMK
jgi:hypothetical protein